MARVRKVILPPGVYRAPQGTLHATPARLRGYAERFNAMRAKGIKIPISWGHQPDALPYTDADKARRQYLLSAYNAGYLESMEVDSDGSLSVEMECPGIAGIDEAGNLLAWTRLPDGREVKSAVGEVSAAIRNWRDGSGTDWPDSIVHVALTPLPVVAGQKGFTAASDPKLPGGEIHLGLTDFLYSLGADTMPDDMPDDLVTTPEDTTPVNEDTGGAKLIDEVKELLESHGVHLPQDTDDSNFMEHLKVALHALKEGGLNNTEPTVDNDMDEDDLGNEPTVQEQRPIMMSTITDPLTRRLLEKEQDKHKASRLKLIDRLVKAQVMKPTTASRLRNAMSSYELSLDRDGNLKQQRVDLELSIWEEVYGTSGQARAGSLKGARIEARPADRTDDQGMEAFAKERAGLISTNR